MAGRLPGNPLDVSRELLNSAEGARLLSYVEAVKVGEDRSVEKGGIRFVLFQPPATQKI